MSGCHVVPRAYRIRSKYGDKVGSCFPELLAKVPGRAPSNQARPLHRVVGAFACYSLHHQRHTHKIAQTLVLSCKGPMLRSLCRLCLGACDILALPKQECLTSVLPS